MIDNDRESFDEELQVRVFLMRRIGFQPRDAQLYQLRAQWNLFYCNQFHKNAHGSERVTGTDADEDVVTFAFVQLGFGRLDERPGKVGLLYVYHLADRLPWDLSTSPIMLRSPLLGV